MYQFVCQFDFQTNQLVPPIVANVPSIAHQVLSTCAHTLHQKLACLFAPPCAPLHAIIKKKKKKKSWL
jgi:hypothetical protein